MYYTVIKHSDHLRTLDKCRKHSPAARVFYISLEFSNARRVLSQCNTRLRLLYLLSKEKMARRRFLPRGFLACDGLSKRRTYRSLMLTLITLFLEMNHTIEQVPFTITWSEFRSLFNICLFNVIGSYRVPLWLSSPPSRCITKGSSTDMSFHFQVPWFTLVANFSQGGKTSSN